MVGATVACLVFASQASAAVSQPSDGWDHTWYTTDTAPHGGTINIQEYGDVFQLCDTYADGFSPNVVVTWPGGSGYSFEDPHGNGTCVEHSASDGYNLPENTEITVDVMLLGSDLGTYDSEHTFLNDN
jgi:hypothetical protein